VLLTVIAFKIPLDGHKMITGEVGATIAARGRGLAVSTAGWRALQEATLEGGEYTVAGDQSIAESLADWFDRSRELLATIPEQFEHPAQKAAICRRAAKMIRSTARTANA
jgi:hypothetical protein